jgi:hypothetical protein
MDEVHISNDATYSPVALTDVMLAAPLVSRVLLGATLPGRVVQAAALGAYAVSALQDWVERQGVRKIDFLVEFGADVQHLPEMPRETREAEVRLLTQRLNDGFTPRRLPREELAVTIDAHLTAYIAEITGQRVETSRRVRGFSLVRLVFPFALGSYDLLSGDVAIFQDTGVFEPHIIAHEFVHRKGYWRELEAQALAYLAMTASEEPALVQAALAERLHRNLYVLSGEDEAEFKERVDRVELRPELKQQFLRLRPNLDPMVRGVSKAMKALYDERMRLTGQNGVSDYDRGFTNFLYAFETSSTARQVPPRAGALHVRVGGALEAEVRAPAALPDALGG